MRLTPTALIVSLLAAFLPAGAHDGGDAESGRLGKVRFDNSCSAAVQPDLQRAFAMLHSFWFNAGEKAFAKLLADDPGCAIATFGSAALLMNNPLAGQGASPKAAEQALALLEQGRRIGAKTQRERDYIEAVAAYYADFANRPERARQQARAQAFEALAARYPEDDEAQIFAALYVAGTQSQADQTYAAYRKASAALERQFAKHPDHPGVAHYLIHSFDAPPIAHNGLTAARKYARIAPDAPHALHMPSHIFTRVGAWQDSVQGNRRSADIAKRDGSWVDAFHAADYMVYAHLQLGQTQTAAQVLREFDPAQGAKLAGFAGPYATAAMPARLALERGDWAAAARLAPLGTAFPHCDAITHFARALGAARSGNLGMATQEAARLAALHKALLEGRNTYWATEVEVQRLSVAAWIAHAQAQGDEALRLMQAAADLEDRNEKHIVTPGRVLPARELLGDLLMSQGKPAAALAEYEQSQQREPHRLRAMAAAAAAAEAAGDKARARIHHARVLAQTQGGDATLPEVARARRFMGAT